MARKANAEHALPKSEALVDSSRGTGLWALNQLRSGALPALMQDLLLLERVGLSPNDCQRVQLALQQMCVYAAEIPDKTLLPVSILDSMQRFLSAYRTWNNPQGGEPHSIEERQKAFVALMKRRHAMATRIRKRMHILSNNLDLKVVDGIYAALSELPKALPDMFRNLAKAIGTYSKRK